MENNFKKWPYFDEGDIQAVSDVLRSGKVNRWTGDKNAEFEKVLCEATGAKYSIALANGSLALELALVAAGVGEGDEVITTCRTFMASASSAVMRGAKPVVVDVDLNSQNLLPEAVEKAITPRTKAIIAVHHAGFPCDMDALAAIAKPRGIFLIEDCAQAHGAVYKGKNIGSIGDVAAWSYCQDKIITTGGEGGAVTTNDPAHWRKMWEYKDHGKSYDAVFNRKHPDGFRWLIESFGTNWRMTEMQAAIGIRWYKKLPEWTKIRNRNAAAYSEALAKFPCVRLTQVPSGITHAFYKCYCFVRPEALKSGWNRDRIAAEISGAGIPCFSGSCWNISAEKCFADAGWSKSAKDLPNAFELGETSLMLLVHPTLGEPDIARANGVIEQVLKSASR
ncbi:MAG: DegT/DnrJ/EryC1/StrS aminotransferase family protein [Opitutales bacterium]|nr:DegT/DnrJ/EryC1/StrS aminotransferase family protein [Opitutales bacterium]